MSVELSRRLAPLDDRSTRPHQPLNEVFPYFSFFLPPQQQVICYPIAGFNNDLRPGHRRFNFIWYRVAGRPC
jgi:hypothetical protein